MGVPGGYWTPQRPASGSVALSFGSSTIAARRGREGYTVEGLWREEKTHHAVRCPIRQKLTARSRPNLDVLAQRPPEVAPPHAHHAAELCALQPVASWVILPQRAPAAVAYRDERPFASGLEGYLNECLLVRRKVGVPPFEGQRLWRVPSD